MTFDEIARAMGISRQLVWFYYCNALKKLRRNGQCHRLREIASAKSGR
jgi:DNA-directed RNA polymerase sigma subunit (sigma70/sigma32)